MKANGTGRIRITHALLGEHGAIYPLLQFIESAAPSADVDAIRLQAALLQSALISHAGLEDTLLRPAIEEHLPKSDGPTDHQVIGAGLRSVIEAQDAAEARRLLLDVIAQTRKHFAKEEAVIFGIAARELAAEDQEQLGDRWAKCRQVAL